PLIAPALLAQVAQLLATHADAAIATACHAIHDAAELFNPNVVKVVSDAAGYAHYFSRAPIPFARDLWARGAGQDGLGNERSLPPAAYFRHIGLYAYRVAF